MLLCEICETMPAPWKIEGRLLCVQCYFKKMRKGELPSFKELGAKKYIDPINSIPYENQENSEGKKMNMFKKEKVNANATQQMEFGTNLNAEAKNKNLDPVLLREKEIERMIRILSRRNKNNPMILGEPGVGKTAIVEGLVQKIVSKEVPKELQNKQIISLNMSNVVAGTKFRGEFEERLKKIIDKTKKDKSIILFIDEIHTLIGAGGAEGAIDASNILKPALSRGEIQIIGATTVDEYVKHMEKDAAFDRRFQRIDLKEPTVEEAIAIMNGLKGKYEEYHGVTITDDAVRSSVELSHKYITGRCLPDKAIDLLDEACAYKKIEQTKIPNHIEEYKKEVEDMNGEKEQYIFNENFDEFQKAMQKETELLKKLTKEKKRYEKKKKENSTIVIEDVAKIVSESTGIPVSKLTKEEKEKTKLLHQELKKDVKGQDEAVEKIAKAIRRNKLGFKDPKRPVGVFLFLGPTGVGKTELAKSVAKTVYGSEDNMIRFDMSEFMEKSSVSRLIGSSPGYIGYEEGGKLTNALKRQPYSLVLFDEVEKAHPEVFNIMLQLFDEGRITDGKGKVVDAKNAIFILTSNVGSEVYRDKKGSLGFSTGKNEAEKALKDKVREKLKGKFTPEFLNRLDEVMIFNELTQETMEEISQQRMKKLVEQMKSLDYHITYKSNVVKHLAKIGLNPDYGARQLKREIENIKDVIADVVLQDESKKEIELIVKNDEILAK